MDGLDKKYTLDEMDRQIKINMRLVTKFGDQLRVEYGENVRDMLKMLDTLYEEQQKVMPLPWYEYCYGVNGTISK